MRSLRMTIAYDGTDFTGWQRQPGKRTVQGEMEAALKRITHKHSAIVASGRTDAGVHALGQVVGFHTPSHLSHAALLKAMNAELPEDICIFEVKDAPAEFHPIRDAVRKRYRYVLEDSPFPDLYRRNYLWRIRKRLDIDAMREASKDLLGHHDFLAYASRGSMRLTSERTVYDISIERKEAELTDRVLIEVEADGFLYNMVRNIVGTLVQVGRRKQPIDWPKVVLASLDRTKAGMTAPARGLYLLWVHYEV